MAEMVESRMGAVAWGRWHWQIMRRFTSALVRSSSNRRLVAGARAAVARDDRTMDAVAVPNFDSWLMMSSRSSTDDAITFTIWRSVPVTRWLSMTFGKRRTNAPS